MTNFFFEVFGVRLANPHYLWFFWSLPLLFFLIIYSEKLRKKAMLYFGIEHFQNMVQNRSIKNSLYLIGVLFLILAVVGPRWGQKPQATRIEGLDLCFALDLSRSMLAEDLSPSRLQSAKNQLTIFLPRLGGDRVSLVAFAGTAFISAPLTPDYPALIGFLEPLDPSFISNQSTDLGQAISTCLSALGLDNFKDQAELFDASSKVIVLISDGEDQVENLDQILERTEKLGVAVFAIAAGTEKGAPIAERDQRGQLLGYLKDPQSNNPVISKLETKALQQITTKTGGELYYLSEGTEAWNRFLKAIENFKRDSQESGSRLDLEDRFQIPLLIALLFLLIDFLIPENRLTRKKNAP